IAAGSNFTGTSAEPSYNIPQIDLPSLCRVIFHVETSPNDGSATGEVWLPPPSEWNRRFLAVGNGGFAGAVNYPDVVWGARKGFATMSTNTGHVSGQLNGTWLLNPEQEIDWGHRALHITSVAAKQIVNEYYPSHFTYSYYAGCSTGGRQGLNAVQKYPGDYDGVLAGSAIPHQTVTSGWQTYVALLQFPNNRSSFIPATMWPTIHQAVLDQCDDIDGVKDGIIMDPSKCSFHPETLLCGKKTANASACLSSDQLVNLKRMYMPWQDDKSNLINPGISPSGETGFTILMNGNEPTFGPIFYSYAIFNNSDWDWSTMNVSDALLAERIDPGGCDAYNPDMRPFQERGGKLIHYHGYSDPLIPTLNAAAFYNLVTSFYEDVGRAADVEDFYRLFTVPGMGHCSGGVGAWVIDGASQGGVIPKEKGSSHSMLWSLVEWVESSAVKSARGKAPESILGTKYVNDTASLGIEFERPVCRWPTVAKYTGGDAKESRNWIC
ncbi:tannase and feruloyl esterase, partial [Rhizodiscina lignyota]